MPKFLANAKPGPVVISCIVTVGFFGIMILMLFKPVALDSRVASILNIMFGNLSAAFGAVVQFHIGSSAGSKAKDDILHSIATGVAGTPPSPPAGAS